MADAFLVPEEQLQRLRATRAGRVSIAGFNYQASYAAMRLAAMLARRPVMGTEAWPTRLRYDWAEDLDEVCEGGTVCFTQCKRVESIGEPAALADVLLGFAPKLLWAPEEARDAVRFRLVCTDLRFAAGGLLPSLVPAEREAVRQQFRDRLAAEPGPATDRSLWQGDACAFGPDELFEVLWGRTEALFLPGTVVSGDPAGPLLEGESRALDLLVRRALLVAADKQPLALARLRRLVHDNLIEFHPTDDSIPDLPGQAPRVLTRNDVFDALFECREHEGGPFPFAVVDRTYLSEQASKPKQPFVLRPPEWADVVHGQDASVKFLERDQTQELYDTALAHLVERVERGTDSRLQVLLVIGAPGSGKSALVRRVAARLVEDGRVVVADAGVNVTDPPGEPATYCQALHELAEGGRPVLLVLDDPFYEESGWSEVLQGLTRPGTRVSVLAATPTFLLDRYARQLPKSAHVQRFTVAPPSGHERMGLADLHGRDEDLLREDEGDFLVLAVEAAGGAPFGEIIDRLWATLNGGQPVGATEFHQLPWPVRAFLATCFFHREYLPCPEPLIRCLLEEHGGVGPGVSVTTALQQLRYEGGWHVFRVSSPARGNWAYTGDQVRTAHQRIALAAWEGRPAPWLDLGDLVAQASVKVPNCARGVGLLTAVVASGPDEAARAFAEALAEAWATVSRDAVETRYVCELVTMLQMHECVDVARRLTGLLQERARPCGDGWMAALALWYLSADAPKLCAFPPDLDLHALVTSADFSLAPWRATKFADRLTRDALGVFVSRLLDALAEVLPWRLDSCLLAWLLSRAEAVDLAPRLPYVTSWLDDHPESRFVRARYMSFLPKLPPQFDDQRRQGTEQMAEWLDGHEGDTTIRTQYLSHLLKLPEQFADLRQQAAVVTAEWLNEHWDDHFVRTQYLSYLIGLSPDPGAPDVLDELRRQGVENTARWLQDTAHEHDTSVRTQYLSYLLALSPDPAAPERLDALRREAAEETAEWLEAHEGDTSVRTQYLSYLLELPAEFAGRRRQAAEDTARWLQGEAHEHDTSVRTQYLSYLLRLPEEFEDQRRQAAEQTPAWLAEHPTDQTVRIQYVRLLCQCLEASELLCSPCEDHCRLLVSMNPGGWVGHNLHARYLLRVERFAEAADEFRAVLGIHKGHQMARMGLARALAALGRLDEAEREFRHAIWWAGVNKQPRAPLLTALARFYLGCERWQDALEAFEAALQERPDHFGSYWGLGRAKKELGDIQGALEALRTALDAPGLRSPAREEIAQLYEECLREADGGTAEGGAE